LTQDNTLSPIQDPDVRDRFSEVGDSGVITKVSPWSMADTLARLSAVIAARGLQVFAEIEYTATARDAGLDLRHTRLLIFGDPSIATPVIEAAPLAALDLPFRVLVWESGHQTRVSYPSPAALACGHGLDGDLADAFAVIDALTSAVIDR